MALDLSHILTGDPDEGQKNHSDLPIEAKMHWADAFAAHAGLSKSPGEYKGPAVTAPDDWETPADTFGAQAENRSEAIQNVSEGGNPPVIPASPKPPLTAQKKPDFSSL